jgi:hypothetical protein
MRRLTSILLSATLLAGALTAISASPANACRKAVAKRHVFHTMRSEQSLDGGVVRASGGMEQVSLLTFNLDIGKTKPTYAIGDTVTIDVTVTRPAKEDPLGNGVPMERPYFEPVEGVIVGVGLHIGRVFLPGGAITDADGVAHVRIKLQPYAPGGAKVDATMYAWKIVYEAPCAMVQEYGYSAMPGMFRTTR